MNHKEDLLGRIASRSARVGVIGLGYVGLPLALVFEEAGFPVLGFDVDPKKPEALHKGESYIKHIGPERVAAAFARGRIAATTDFSRLAECDAILICVPTPLGKHREPDISYIQKTAEAIAAVARPGQLVVLESTTYPGTTREEILPKLEGKGLTCGESVFVAFSPEREDPGNPSFHTRNIPKVVGGIDAPSGDVAEALYAGALDKVVRVSTAEVAESGKLLENIFRSVNIALVNELKVVFDKMGIDVWEVIEAAKSKPFGYMPFYPGPGIGGHCLAGTESVRVRSGSFDTVLTLSALFELYEGRAKGFSADGADVVLPDDLEALSVDPLSGESAWKPVSFLFRRPYEGDMVDIRLAGNRLLRTTDRHPMLVVAGDDLVVRDARDLQPGDRLPLTGSPDANENPCPGEDPALDLLSLLPAVALDKVHVRIQGTPWSRHELLLKAKFGWKIRDSIRGNSLAAGAFLAIEHELGVSRSGLVLLAGKGNSHTSLPALIPITPGFCRFLGYYLSEGCITEERGNPRIRLTFNRDETEYINDVRQLMAEIGVGVSQHEDHQWHTSQLRVASSLLGYVLRDVLQTGTDCYTMRIPKPVMQASAVHREQVLAGLIRGDGDVDVRMGSRPYSKNGRDYVHQFNSGKVGYFSSSPELFGQAESLLLDLGFAPMRKQGKPHLRIAGDASLKRLARLLGGDKGRKLDQLDTVRVRRQGPRRTLRWKGGFAAPVVSVTPGKGREDVFSVEVPGSHTFAATGGVFVHNCIPLDPFYLSWKAAEHGAWARFIELAGEINTSMPYYVVDKTVKALNKQGKSIKGAKVLVLGLSYKADIDDDRESPSYELIDLLDGLEADWAYCDPFIPTARLGRKNRRHMYTVPCSAEEFARYDALLVATAHAVFREPALYAGVQLLVDTRNLFPTHALVSSACPPCTIVRA